MWIFFGLAVPWCCSLFLVDFCLRGYSVNLAQDGLGAARRAVVAVEALAEAGAVVAEAAAGAVPALPVVVAAERVGAGRALPERAVRAAEALVALAAVVVLGVPGSVGCDIVETNVFGLVCTVKTALIWERTRRYY